GKDSKLDKVPYNARTGRSGSSTNPKSWATFDEAIQAYERGRYHGIGFYFGNGFAGIDLDACRDLETGEVAWWALEIVAEVESYTETSPSETGLHIFCKGCLPQDEEKGLNRIVDGHRIEMYSRARFFTFTGNVLAGSLANVYERQDSITALYNRVLETCTAQDNVKRCASIEGSKEPADWALLSDDQIISLLSRAKNAAKFKRLWSGDCATDFPMEGRPEGDHSAADLALCAMLAFYTRTPAQIDRIFRRSSL